jgi:hypothetical protein
MYQNSFDENSLVTLSHLLCGPHLAPSDFSILGQIKASFAEPVFNEADELLEAVVESLNEIQPSEMQLVFHHWNERIKSV